MKTLEELFSGYEWRVTLDEASLPDGRVKKTARIHRCDTVHIIAFKEQDTILLLREFRPFYGQYVWMLPTGRVNKETDHAKAAQRELQEETGHRAEVIEYYASSRHSETFDSANHVYIAKNLTRSPLPQDEDELIEVHELPYEEALEKVLSSPVVHTASAYALLRYDREKRTDKK